VEEDGRKVVHKFQINRYYKSMEGVEEFSSFFVFFFPFFTKLFFMLSERRRQSSPTSKPKLSHPDLIINSLPYRLAARSVRCSVR